MIVELTQFHPPHGRTSITTCEVPDDCAANYKAMQEAGCRLTCEVLSTGHVSICIEHPDAGDYDIRLVSNGPNAKYPGGPPDATAEMLRRFDPRMLANFIAAATE